MVVVKVVDAICGAGKSTQVMEHMRRNTDKRWIYASPYLSEVGDGNNTVGRIRENLPEMDFQCPRDVGGRGKTFHLKQLLASGCNISTTHSLLAFLDKDCLKLIKDNNYHLVIDETLDVISISKSIHTDDIKGLVGGYVIKDEATGRLRWNYEKYGDNYRGHFLDIKNMCDLGSLYLHRDIILINKLSPEVMSVFVSVKILTYMFEGSFMCAWLKLSGVKYEYEDLQVSDEYYRPDAIKSRVRDKLKIRSTPRSIDAHNYGSNGLETPTSYSATWYKYKKQEGLLSDIKRGCQSFLTMLRKEKIQNKVFWTTFKDYEKDLVGDGYKRGTVVSDDGERVSPFLAKNKRASNEHADCNVCMYLVNVYAHGDISSYLEGQGVELDNNAMAISEMVQFIFRGSIRRGEDMYLMVASNRMKKLLEEWLLSDK